MPGQLTQVAFMDTTRYETVNGHKIAYHREGTGVPLILIHGITTYSFIWRKLFPSLAEHNDVIALDLLGCGDSDKPADVDYSISAQADMIKLFMDQLGVERCHLVCHDIGGGIGQILATRYQERTHTLTLVNSIGYDYWPVQPISTMRIPFFRQIGMAVLDAGFLEVLIKRGLYHKERCTDDLMNNYYRPLRTPEGRRGFLRLAKCLDNGDLMSIVDDLQNLSIPVLIIRGDEDVYLKPDIAERLHREIKTSRLERIETGGHFIQEDEPEWLVGLIKDFAMKHGV